MIWLVKIKKRQSYGEILPIINYLNRVLHGKLLKEILLDQFQNINIGAWEEAEELHGIELLVEAGQKKYFCFHARGLRDISDLARQIFFFLRFQCVSIKP